MIVIAVFPKRKFDRAVVPWRPRVPPLLSLHRHPTRFLSQVHCPSLVPTIFYATGWSRRLSPIPEKPFLIFHLLAPGGHYVRRPVLEARNCPRS